MKLLSPLRYPGGKAGLAPFLSDILELNDIKEADYFEPYAGGAGAALALLSSGRVRRILINDADFRIYSFWHTIINDPMWFVDRIVKARLDLKEWREQREICLSSGSDMKDIGFAAFYMNRCNRSGVLNSGPIGGYEQAGEWRLNARFTKPALIKRVMDISNLRDKIEVSNLDAVAFLKERLPSGNGRKKSFVYLDPPYVEKGRRLYLNAYKPDDHGEISKYIAQQKVLPWIMSYDDSELVRYLYKNQQIAFLPIRYSLQKKRTANELIIAPRRVRLPKTMRIGSGRFDLKEVNSGSLV